MRPCAAHDGHHHPAELAATDNPPAPTVTDHYAPVLGGELTGGQYVPLFGVEASSAPPPAAPAALPPQRPATGPQGRRISLLRFVPSFPLQLGAHGDVARVLARPTATQLTVELRGSTFRAAPDNPDPSWAEVSQ